MTPDYSSPFQHPLFVSLDASQCLLMSPVYSQRFQLTKFAPQLRSSDYSFVGCMVGPGFDFADFELGSRSDLLADYPQHKDEIVKLTEGLP